MGDNDASERFGAAVGADMIGRQMLCFNLVMVALCAGAWVWAAIFNHWWPF